MLFCKSKWYVVFCSARCNNIIVFCKDVCCDCIDIEWGCVIGLEINLTNWLSKKLQMNYCSIMFTSAVPQCEVVTPVTNWFFCFDRHHPFCQSVCHTLNYFILVQYRTSILKTSPSSLFTFKHIFLNRINLLFDPSNYNYMIQTRRTICILQILNRIESQDVHISFAGHFMWIHLVCCIPFSCTRGFPLVYTQIEDSIVNNIDTNCFYDWSFHWLTSAN